MIVRVWHGWTTQDHAAAYQTLLLTEIFPGIEARATPGYRGIELLRRDGASEVEFITVMRFESWDAVRAFAGDDPETAVVPPKARAVLSRFDARSQHYELVESRPA